MVHVRDVSGEFERRDAAVLGVTAQDPELLDRFLDAHEFPYTIVNDADRKVIRDYGIAYDTRDYDPASTRGFVANPTDMIVDADGVVRYLYIGENASDFPPDEEIFRALDVIG